MITSIYKEAKIINQKENKMLITKYIECDIGHRVLNHKSKCRNLHGHRYRIEVGVDDKVITTSGSSDEGMVIDFSDLKEIMMDEIDRVFDHGLILAKFDTIYHTLTKDNVARDLKIIGVDFIPTAENLAKYWYQLIKPKLKERNIKIKFVRVFETPTSTATYEE